MRTILIDPHTQTITNLELPDHELDHLYAALDCRGVDVIRLGQAGIRPEGVDLWVNDEGLLAIPRDDAGNVTQGFFVLHGGGQPQHLVAGKALVTGVNAEGDTLGLPPYITPALFQRFIRFMPAAQRNRAAELAGEIVNQTGMVDSQAALTRLRAKQAALLREAWQLTHATAPA